MFKLQRGDLVCGLNKEPEPSINMVKVEEVLADSVVRVIWKDGTTSERPVGRLAKLSRCFSLSSSFGQAAQFQRRFLRRSSEPKRGLWASE
jgi:hypothetical protein